MKTYEQIENMKLIDVLREYFPKKELEYFTKKDLQTKIIDLSIDEFWVNYPQFTREYHVFINEITN